jgi:hypothetical protein
VAGDIVIDTGSNDETLLRVCGCLDYARQELIPLSNRSPGISMPPPAAKRITTARWLNRTTVWKTGAADNVTRSGCSYPSLYRQQWKAATDMPSRSKNVEIVVPDDRRQEPIVPASLDSLVLRRAS